MHKKLLQRFCNCNNCLYKRIAICTNSFVQNDCNLLQLYKPILYLTISAILAEIVSLQRNPFGISYATLRASRVCVRKGGSSACRKEILSLFTQESQRRGSQRSFPQLVGYMGFILIQSSYTWGKLQGIFIRDFLSIEVVFQIMEDFCILI